MKQKLTYNYLLRGWIIAIIFAVISALPYVIEFIRFAFARPMNILDYWISNFRHIICQIVFIVLLLTRKNIKLTSILLIILLSFSTYYDLYPILYGDFNLFSLIASALQILAIIWIIRGQRTEVIFICCIFSLALFHAININLTHKLFYYDRFYKSSMNSSIMWLISDISLFAGLIIFSLYNILPPLVPVSLEQSLKHLSLAKKKRNISEEEYNEQRENTISSL